jgi:hypothetical protein
MKPPATTLPPSSTTTTRPAPPENGSHRPLETHATHPDTLHRQGSEGHAAHPAPSALPTADRPLPTVLSPAWWAGFTNPDLPLPGVVIPGTGGYRRVSAAEYHAFPAVNASVMKCRTAAEMLATLSAPPRDGPTFVLGTLVRLACLRREQAWADQFALVQPPVNPRTDRPYALDTRRGQDAWAEARAAHPGRILVTEEDFQDHLATCRDLQNALHANADALQELDGAHVDVTGILWHPRWQCWVKWRPDVLPRHLRHLVDIKTTTRHVAEFSRDAWQHGYHLQAAWYAEMHQRLLAPRHLRQTKMPFVVLSRAEGARGTRPAMCRVYDVPLEPGQSRGVDHARRTLGLPEGFGRVDILLDSLRQHVEAGCPAATAGNTPLIRRLWPAYEHEAGESGRRVLAD